MKLFHRTLASDAILRDGFKDATGGYLTDQEHAGVFLSVDPNLGDQELPEAVVLVIDIPEAEIAEFEWIEEGKPYREFLVPASVVNRFGPPSIHDEADEVMPTA